MRAVFLKEDFVVNQLKSITGDSAHHLNVVRIKENDEIILLNGNGKKGFAKIISTSKKEIVVKIERIEEAENKNKIEVVFSTPKKDASEDIIKFCVELGVSKIQPLTSKFSQSDFVANERMERIIESAMIQSNNLFWPEILPQISLEKFLEINETKFVYFSSQPIENSLSINSNEKVKILIGPEGGFSPDESEKILLHKNVNQIHFNTPILRAPTAVATSIGYLLSLLN
jgi:16S rRNA (uracil1498-N3)-methyltransferase